MSPLPYAFRDPALLRTALTVPAPNRRLPDNQRLEFLGDAVLQLLVSECLYALYPEADEGVLTDMRLHLVSGKALLARADRLGLGALLAERNLGHAWPQKAVADAVEAVVGAAWLDGGKEGAQALFDTLFREDDFHGLRHCTGDSDNPKGALQQLGQKRFRSEPVYALVATEGPSHAPRFRCSASLGGKTAEGAGTSRKAAEAEAARALLGMLEAKEAEPTSPNAD